ncbi:CAAX family protease [Liquorilactobacillus cacaonum DSM 21116]|uniref:CAAX family protease n=2 Tax=Liquorilactobacillus cacaonum TaxID=483012 RepID=A0A0R2CFD4_9LACO|nr:CAAX family protease [Liquorilactobacillus cacaonum DSM 21116]
MQVIYHSYTESANYNMLYYKYHLKRMEPLMNIRRNSLFLLLTYLIVMLFSSSLFSIIKDSMLSFTSVIFVSIFGAFLMFFINKKVPFENYIELGNKSLKKSLLYGIFGVALVFVVQELTLLVDTYLLHQSTFSENTNQILTILTHYPYYLLYVIIAAPIMEEFIFRKVFFGNLSTIIKPGGAAIFSSILFSVAHADGHYLTYSCLGLTLSYIYYKSHDIKAPIITHSLMNLIIILTQIK